MFRKRVTGKRVTVSLGSGVIDTADIDRKDDVCSHILHSSNLTSQLESSNWTYRQIIHVPTVNKHISLLIRHGRKKPRQRHTRTNISPCVPRRMNLHSKLQDVGRITIKRKPKILNMRIPKCFPNPTIKLMARGVTGSRPRQVRCQSPKTSHSPSKFLGSSVNWNRICVLG